MPVDVFGAAGKDGTGRLGVCLLWLEGDMCRPSVRCLFFERNLGEDLEFDGAQTGDLPGIRCCHVAPGVIALAVGPYMAE